MASSWGSSWGPSWGKKWGVTTPVPEDNGWLGGPTDYAVRKKHLEELDRIDEKIRKNRLKEAMELLSETPEVPIQIPEIRKIDRKLLNDLKRIKKSEFNIQALQAEIALIREYLLAQQIQADLLDDETAFLLMLQ